MSLYHLLSERGPELIDRWAVRARASFGGALSRVELTDHMPSFIKELTAVLRPEVVPPPEAASANAEEHGLQRLRLGFDIGEVVREYGLLHLSILELAEEASIDITAREYKILGETLNRGTADAVTQYQGQRDNELQRQAAEHLGFIAHELRNPLATAQMALAILRRRLPEGVSASQSLDRALTRLSGMINSALSHSWLRAGAPIRVERVDLGKLVSEVERDVSGEAEANGITVVTQLEPITMQADPRLLLSALTNLVRNALKFGRRGSKAVIRARRRPGRVVIEVEDECGGLPAGRTEELFTPFVQKGADRSGFGLGLAIARQAAESHSGTISVTNLPGQGCVFVIDMPEVTSPSG